MTGRPPADGSPVLAVLDDGPAAGETVDTHIGHLLPPLYVTTLVPHLDERAETLAWVETRYERAALYRTRDMDRPEEPWRYFHNPAPGEPAVLP